MVMEGLCSSELWSYSHAYYHTAFLIMTENSFLIKNRFLINIYFFFYINHCIHDIITGKKRFVTLMLLKAQISSHYVLLKVVFMKEAPDFFFFLQYSALILWQVLFCNPVCLPRSRRFLLFNLLDLKVRYISEFFLNIFFNF